MTVHKKKVSIIGAGFVGSGIANAILNNRQVKLSVTSLLDGEYGLFDVALSLPTLIDANGVKEVLKIELDEKEAWELANSAKSLKSVIESLRASKV